jgi:membrane protein required for colicin V production
MNSIDIFILIFIAFFFVRGLFRGFVIELTALIGLVLGYFIAISYVGVITTLILAKFPDLPASAVKIIIFAILFVATNVLLKLVAQMITKTLKFAMLGWLNRWLGAVFGMLKSILILCIIVLIIDFLPFSETALQNEEVQNSQLYPILDTLGPELYRQINNLSLQVL